MREREVHLQTLGTNAKGVNSSAPDPAVSDRFFCKYWLYHWIPLMPPGIRFIVAR